MGRVVDDWDLTNLPQRIDKKKLGAHVASGTEGDVFEFGHHVIKLQLRKNCHFRLDEEHFYYTMEMLVKNNHHNFWARLYDYGLFDTKDGLAIFIITERLDHPWRGPNDCVKGAELNGMIQKAGLDLYHIDDCGSNLMMDAKGRWKFVDLISFVYDGEEDEY